MPEDYSSKKARLERISNTLIPVLLRGKVPQRHVEDVAGLPDSARVTLANCLEKQIRINFPKAIQALKQNPETSCEELANRSVIARPTPHLDNSPGTYLKDVLMKCYPNMQEETAVGLAGSLPMKDVAVLAKALEQIKTPQNMNTDFIIVVIYALLRGALDELTIRILSTPVFIQAVKQSNLPLPDKK